MDDCVILISWIAGAVQHGMSFFDHWLAAEPGGIGALASIGWFARKTDRAKKNRLPALVQEGPGFYLGISRNSTEAGKHAARELAKRYDDWIDGGWRSAETQFKCDHFTIAVGGGNTVKAQYQALLADHGLSIDWLQHVRFFFLEGSSDNSGWESSRTALLQAFIRPLASKLRVHLGNAELTERLCLARSASSHDIEQAMQQRMVYPIDMRRIDEALAQNDAEKARKLARTEARRYQKTLTELLGEDMVFHCIVSGIGKDGGIGAFAPYTPQLQKKEPAVVVLERANGALLVALNRGILIAAQSISLIIAGSLKLKALGRFEMEDSADFEQTVLETPIRMLRESRQIAENVAMFADDRALFFDEGLFQFREGSKTVKVRCEVRDGLEPDGVHLFLVHGFMGLYSFINFLIRLPSDWRISALHRGSRAKKLADEQIFPHYARGLRQAILQNWRYQRPTPVGCHSIAGIISDHLLLSVLENYGQALPEFEDLSSEHQQLLLALRAGGLINLASWAPSDVVHINATIKNLMSHRRHDTPLDYSGPASVYTTRQGVLELNDTHSGSLDQRPPLMASLGKLPGTERSINALTLITRRIFNHKRVQQLLSNRETPYALRIIGGRMLKKISFYGLLKEVNAALHDPEEYQRRHLLALDAIVKYDIPYLSIIHHDDFMVSANRHAQEHRYLVAARKKKEGVRKESELTIPARFVLLRRQEEELPVDPLNPHLLLMSTSIEGDKLSRQVTAAVTDFVNENVARAIANGSLAPLPSVTRWQRKKKAAPR